MPDTGEDVEGKADLGGEEIGDNQDAYRRYDTGKSRSSVLPDLLFPEKKNLIWSCATLTEW